MKAYELYYGENGEGKFNRFLSANEERILSLLSPSISSSVTRYFLGDTTLSNKDLLLDLGLINEEGITKRGEKIISSYPLFGTGKEKSEPYSTEFFPFLFSLLSTHSIPLNYERYLSSLSFASLFPWRDEEECTEEAKYVISSLIKMRLVLTDSDSLSLNRIWVEKFMEKDEMTRLSCIFLPEGSYEERKALKHYLFMLSKFNGVKKSELNGRLSLISQIAGIEVPLSLLTTFGLLRESNKTWSATKIENDNESYTLFSTDMTISYRGNRERSNIWKIAEPLKADTINQWVITKESIKGALDFNMKEEEIYREIETLSSSSIPSSIKERISSWVKEYGRVKAHRAVILDVDDRCSMILELLPQARDYIISHPSKNLFIMDGDKEAEWRTSLKNAGFDMLGETQGPRFEKDDDYPIIPTFLEEEEIPSLRELPFNEEQYNSILNHSDSLVMKSLVSSSLVFSSKKPISLNWIDALDYEEKLKIVNKAIAEKDKLALSWTNDKEAIVNPLSIKEINEKRILETTTGELDFDKIWKVAILPSYVTSMESNS